MPINTSDPKGCRMGCLLALVSAAVFVAIAIVFWKVVLHG